GTSFVENTLRSLGIKQPHDMLGEKVKVLRQRLKIRGVSVDQLDDAQVRDIAQKNLDSFRDDAPLSAAQAAAQILDAVRTGKWRLLVGEDAEVLDRGARAHTQDGVGR